MPYEYEGMFVDGENCIIFENDLSNLTDKIDYYLENHDERNRIISNAYDFAKENYTWMAMAKRLVSKIEEIKDEL